MVVDGCYWRMRRVMTGRWVFVRGAQINPVNCVRTVLTKFQAVQNDQVAVWRLSEGVDRTLPDK